MQLFSNLPRLAPDHSIDPDGDLPRFRPGLGPAAVGGATSTQGDRPRSHSDITLLTTWDHLRWLGEEDQLRTGNWES